MEVLLKLSILIFAGVVGGRIANKFGLPNVSGYIIGGLIMGPSLFNVIASGEGGDFNIINDIALAAIAFSIGSEFLLEDVKKMGKDVIVLTFAEVIGAVVLVFVAMYYIFDQPMAFSLVIASMSAATAPAGLMLVIRELKADGPLIRTMLPVVAIDDALGIMVFGVSLSVAKILSGTGDVTLSSMLLAPLYEIVGSLVLGLIIGLVLVYFANRSKGRDELLIIVVGFILLATGLSNQIGVSPLLTCMMQGAVVMNMMKNSKRVFNLIGDITPPINILFFTLAGASLDLSILSQVGLIGLGYICARAAGKIIGATLGAKALKLDETIVKYLGMSLLTQGGISIGLSMIVSKELPEYSDSIITVILFSVLIYEILGPILAKIAIQKAGEENGALKRAENK